jgi:hypothetical protein
MVGPNQYGHNDRDGLGAADCGAGEKLSCLLPEDFRQYLRVSSPVGEEMDAEMVTWWGIGRVKNIPDEFPHALAPIISDEGKKYLFFADYCIWCWAWAISCADDDSRGKVALIAGHPYDRFVANSFSDFVQTYLSDARSVMHVGDENHP